MQENKLFEYAVIRCVPFVEREEFLNVGVILYSKKDKYIDVKFQINEDKLKTFCSELDVEEFTKHINAYKRIALAKGKSGPIGELELGERFRWLTATRSTILQSSKVHPGLSKDLEQTLYKLFNEQVL